MARIRFALSVPDTHAERFACPFPSMIPVKHAMCHGANARILHVNARILHVHTITHERGMPQA
eukprot:5698671-Amphidinium_carterae.1